MRQAENGDDYLTMAITKLRGKRLRVQGKIELHRIVGLLGVVQVNRREGLQQQLRKMLSEDIGGDGGVNQRRNKL